MLGEVAGGRLHLAAHAVVSLRGGAAHYVSHDVAASAQRCEHRLTDFMDGFPEVAFRNAMQLEPLPRGDAQRSIGNRSHRSSVPSNWPAVKRPPGIFRTHHEHVPLAHSRHARFASVAVVLLVGAVKLQQRHIVGGEFVRLAKQSSRIVPRKNWLDSLINSCFDRFGF